MRLLEPRLVGQRLARQLTPVEPPPYAGTKAVLQRFWNLVFIVC